MSIIITTFDNNSGGALTGNSIRVDSNTWVEDTTVLSPNTPVEYTGVQFEYWNPGLVVSPNFPPPCRPGQCGEPWVPPIDPPEPVPVTDTLALAAVGFAVMVLSSYIHRKIR
jgi:hypothetical protein